MAHELRVCGWCYGAGRYTHAERATERPVVVSCERCDGSGRTWAFLYEEPQRKSSVRRIAEGRLMFLCWHGTAREKLLAEKELRRREGRSR